MIKDVECFDGFLYRPIMKRLGSELAPLRGVCEQAVTEYNALCASDEMLSDRLRRCGLGLNVTRNWIAP